MKSSQLDYATTQVEVNDIDGNFVRMYELPRNVGLFQHMVNEYSWKNLSWLPSDTSIIDGISAVNKVAIVKYIHSVRTIVETHELI